MEKAINAVIANWIAETRGIGICSCATDGYPALSENCIIHGWLNSETVDESRDRWYKMALEYRREP